MEVKFKICGAMFSDEVVTTSSEASYREGQVCSFSPEAARFVERF
jgi:hypothetical protein